MTPSEVYNQAASRFGVNAVKLDSIARLSSLTKTLCTDIMTDSISEAELINDMANCQISLDQLTLMFSQKYQKYMSRVGEQKKNNLLKMEKALKDGDDG